MQKLFLFFSVVLLCPLPLFAQLKLDVDGPARINGALDLSAPGNSIFIGTSAGAMDNGSDNQNVFLGYSAGFFNTTGNFNVFLGTFAGYSNISGGGNVFLGPGAGFFNTTGNFNVFLGFLAGYSNTTGYDNVFLGDKAGYFNTTGNNNVFLGDSTGYSNTTGYDNVFLGDRAGHSNTTGNNNVFLGDSTGYSNTTGYENIFLGDRAGYSNLNGKWNVFLGYQAGYFSTTGRDNTLIGFQAGYYNTEGNSNVFIGEFAGWLNKTGTNRTGLGRSANSIGTNYDNSTGLGSNADPTAANIVHIGNASITSIKGQVDFTTYSDGRFKRQVKRDEVPGLDFIQELEPVTYHVSVDAFADWKAAAYGERDTADWKGKYDVEKIKFTGFIAQEVEAAAEKIGYDFSGVDKPANDKSFYGLRYATFVVPLVQGMQEQQEMIEEQEGVNSTQQKVIEQQQEAIDRLESEVSKANAENEALRNRLDRLERAMSNLLGEEAPQGQTTWLTSARLDQNIPNPFNNSTTVRYFIPQDVRQAEIRITDLTGKVIKNMAIQDRGEGQITFDSTTLSSGNYQYSLFINGRLLDTKQMVLSRN